MSQISLLEILREKLVGKKIKLYKVFDTSRQPQGIEYFLTSPQEIKVSRNVNITGESFGFIKSVYATNLQYEGDAYNFTVTDEKGTKLHINGLNSIECSVEILD